MFHQNFSFNVFEEISYPSSADDIQLYFLFGSLDVFTDVVQMLKVC